MVGSVWHIRAVCCFLCADSSVNTCCVVTLEAVTETHVDHEHMSIEHTANVCMLLAGRRAPATPAPSWQLWDGEGGALLLPVTGGGVDDRHQARLCLSLATWWFEGFIPTHALAVFKSSSRCICALSACVVTNVLAFSSVLRRRCAAMPPLLGWLFPRVEAPPKPHCSLTRSRCMILHCPPLRWPPTILPPPPFLQEHLQHRHHDPLATLVNLGNAGARRARGGGW